MQPELNAPLHSDPVFLLLSCLFLLYVSLCPPCLPPHCLSFPVFSQGLILNLQCKPMQGMLCLFQLLSSFEAIPQCCGILSSAGAYHQISDLVLMENMLQEMVFPFR